MMLLLVLPPPLWFLSSFGFTVFCFVFLKSFLTPSALVRKVITRSVVVRQRFLTPYLKIMSVGSKYLVFVLLCLPESELKPIFLEHAHSIQIMCQNMFPFFSHLFASTSCSALHIQYVLVSLLPLTPLRLLPVGNVAFLGSGKVLQISNLHGLKIHNRVCPET